MQYADEAHAFRLRRSGARGPRNWDELQMVRAQHRQETVSVAPATEELAGDVPVRIITPADAPCGVLLDIHSGGFYMGAASDNDVRNRALADRLGVAVVSVDYRLAPEHPWPAAPDDCETVAKWLAESAEARFGTGRLVIGGVSGGDAGHDDAAAPARPRHRRLRGGGPAVRDIRPQCADAGRAAGVDVDLRVYPESPHGFTLHPTAMAHAALDDIHGWIVDCLGQRTDLRSPASDQPARAARNGGMSPN